MGGRLTIFVHAVDAGAWESKHDLPLPSTAVVSFEVVSTLMQKSRNERWDKMTRNGSYWPLPPLTCKQMQQKMISPIGTGGLIGGDRPPCPWTSADRPPLFERWSGEVVSLSRCVRCGFRKVAWRMKRNFRRTRAKKKEKGASLVEGKSCWRA